MTAIGIASLHTVLGPDHYLPFIALSKAHNWSFGKTFMWVIICGCGHVWSSVLLGLGGALLGWNLSKISWLENVRGGMAGWALLLFGLLYCLWGLWRAWQNKSHKHFDTYQDGNIYVYEHKHGQAVASAEKHKVTPWVMFIIFLLGPCEPMIPLLFVPAAKNSIAGMIILIAVYTLFTLITMLVMVLLGYYGLKLFKTEKLERYMHALGGLALFVSGAGILFMGW
jgi:sulfite exporter TauE/SafE